MARDSLYQVMVETRDGRAIPVSPAMMRRFLEPFCKAIAIAVRAGTETRWSNPHIVPVSVSADKRRPGPRIEELARMGGADDQEYRPGLVTN